MAGGVALPSQFVIVFASTPIWSATCGIPTGNEPAEVIHPGKEVLHFPSLAIAAQHASALCSAFCVCTRSPALTADFKAALCNIDCGTFAHNSA